MRIGSTENLLPLGTDYTDVDVGEPVCVYRVNQVDGREYVILALNAGNLAKFLKIADIRSIEADPGYEVVWADGYGESTPVTLSLAQKQGYANEYRLHQIENTRTNKRADYPSLTDAEYANFRAVNTTGMGKDTLFRSSSPINPVLARNEEADAQLLHHLVRTVLNMENSENAMRSYPDFYSTSYSGCNIIALDMGMDFHSEVFREKLAKGFRFTIKAPAISFDAFHDGDPCAGPDAFGPGFDHPECGLRVPNPSGGFYLHQVPHHGFHEADVFHSRSPGTKARGSLDEVGTHKDSDLRRCPDTAFSQKDN